MHNNTEWVNCRGLRLAPNKADSVPLIRGREKNKIISSVGENVVHLQESLRYLRLHFYSNIRMRSNVRITAEETGKHA